MLRGVSTSCCKGCRRCSLAYLLLRLLLVRLGSSSGCSRGARLGLALGLACWACFLLQRRRQRPWQSRPPGLLALLALAWAQASPLLSQASRKVAARAPARSSSSSSSSSSAGEGASALIPLLPAVCPSAISGPDFCARPSLRSVEAPAPCSAHCVKTRGLLHWHSPFLPSRCASCCAPLRACCSWAPQQTEALRSGSPARRPRLCRCTLVPRTDPLARPPCRCHAPFCQQLPGTPLWPRQTLRRPWGPG